MYSHPLRRSRAAIALVTFTAAAGACGPAVTRPTTPPDFRGTYAGTWSLSLNQSPVLSCTGTLSVTDQVGNAFSGHFAIDSSDACVSVGGDLSGVDDDVPFVDEVRVTLSIPPSDSSLVDVAARAFRVMSGCTDVDPFMNGSTMVGLFVPEKPYVSLDHQIETSCPSPDVGTDTTTWYVEFRVP